MSSQLRARRVKLTDLQKSNRIKFSGAVKTDWHESDDVPVMKKFLKKIYRGLTRAARITGIPISVALMTVFYIVGMGLTALFARLFVRDLLSLKFQKEESYLRERPPDDTSVEAAQRQH